MPTPSRVAALVFLTEFTLKERGCLRHKTRPRPGAHRIKSSKSTANQGYSRQHHKKINDANNGIQDLQATSALTETDTR
jgi:hypothetical protein